MILPGKPLLALNGFELSDHSRAPLEVGFVEIKSENRTVSGTLRKFVVARKRTLTTSWELLPSHSQFTVDEHMGGVQLREFYLTHPEFEVSVNADISADPDVYNPDIKMMGYFTDFSYSIVKRNVGGIFYDYWNINLAIEEI